jgi:phosphoserine phosphatase
MTPELPCRTGRAARVGSAARWLVAFVLSAAMLLLAGCGDSGDDSEDDGGTGCRILSADPGWYHDNRDRINAMITQLAACGKPGSVANGAPLAVLDWDNTMVKHNVGNATFFWMVRNSKIRQPANGDWATTSQYLTPAAAAALAAACGGLAAPGQPLPTSSNNACGDEVTSVFMERQTHTGTPAFANYNHRRIDPTDAWGAQLLAGWTDADVTGFAQEARQQNLDAAEGTKQQVGTSRQTGYVRYYAQMRDLIGTLQTNGFDVRIVSGSPELIIRVWAADVGIPADRVMGTRTEHDGDVLTTRLPQCGGETSIPFNEGKRCRINQEVYGIAGAAAFDQSPEPRRQVFAAGDSDGDATFVQDATALRLVINRNQIELMCRAYANLDGRWLVNPMFIKPRVMSSPYPCATQGFDEPNGDQGPLRRPDGSVVPDQDDRVHR